MSSERWRQIEALYHQAREHGPAVLEQTDPELRREVEKLLAQDSEGKILDFPAADLLEGTTVTRPQTGGLGGYSGQTVSHYHILEKLGAGGMGVVYKAFDTKLNRLVALKFLPPHLSHNPELKRRLTDEARAASALDDPNIVVIHEIDETSAGDLFVAMAFHGDITLRKKIEAGLGLAEALQIARQLASGLAKAHQHGIVHRDIKPSNIIIAPDGVARIIDFGLAKSSDATATADGQARGTPLYMSPEQASGRNVDPRTDVWSLGAVLYEMLAGEPPFRGDTQLQVMHAVVHDDPPRLREVRPDFPAAVDAIVRRALEKDPSKRYPSAAEMGNDLSAVLTSLNAPTPQRSGVKAAYVIPAAVLILLAAGVFAWLYQRSEKRHWAREQAMPEIARLASEKKILAASQLLEKAQQYLPGDSQLAQFAADLTHTASVHSTPSGAAVAIKDYLTPDAPWTPLGTTPLENVRIPSGYLRWKVSKPGVGEFTGAPIFQDIHGLRRQFDFSLEAIPTAPKGMVPIPAMNYGDMVWSLGFLGPYDLPLFYIDQFEVTNRQYQEFVDAGGYRKREYWKEKFLRDGKELSWEQAMEVFRDTSGRPGPSTWEAGHFPAGQADYPVGGVSWYEASAYAGYAGKSLPAIIQWFLAAPSSVAKYVIPQSNFSLSALAPAGRYQGLGAWGTYDMGGNVTEWGLNEGGRGSPYMMGGAWNTSSAEYFEPGVTPAMTRLANSGFRCVKNTAPLPAAVTAMVPQRIRDFAKAKPVADDVYHAYLGMYAYDKTPLHAVSEPVPQDSPDWRKEKISIDAAYGNERFALYLFVPAKVRPPYQVVVFFPSARVLDLASSASLGDMQFVDFVIKSGRAVLYPVFKGTYERPAILADPSSVESRDTVIQDVKDLGRSIDYLETRADFDRNRIGFMGVSMGASWGLILTAVEQRIKTVILLDGGFFEGTSLPGTDQADFATRIKVPTLMISGKYDWIFLGKDALLRLLGASEADKKAILYETSHDVSEQRADLVRDVVAWLDKYFGKVN